MAKPALHDQEAEDDACAVLGASGLFGSSDDLMGDDLAVRLGDLLLLQLAGDTLLDEVAQTERNLSHIGSRNGRLDRGASMHREH